MAGLQEAMAPKAEEKRAPDDGPEPNVTPEEQAAYDEFMNNARKVIFEAGEGPVNPQILKGLQAGEDRVLALATAGLFVVKALEASAKASGATIDDTILMHAGEEILVDLADIAEAAGIHDYTEPEIERAYAAALQMYVGERKQAGNLDEEQLVADFQQIAQADKEGRLNELLPGFEEGAEALTPEEAEDG